MTPYMFSHAYNLVYSLEYEQLVLSEPTNLQNETTNWSSSG